MKWNVYIYNINRQKIEAYNIFEHGFFLHEIKNAIKKANSKDNFEERLKSELRYYFWSKAEWEVIIAPWCGNKNPDEIKVDVYDQVMMNWEIFVDYVWENKDKL